MIKNKRGSITIEAAISLPIFIFCIFTIAFIIRIIYIQEKVQFAVTNAANEMAMYSYLYDKSGILETVNVVKGATQEEKEATDNNLYETLNSLTVIQDSIENIILEFQDVKDALEGATDPEEIDFKLNTSGGNVFQGITDTISKVSKSRQNIEESAKTAYSSIESGLSGFSQLFENNQNLIGFATYEGLKSFETVLGNACIKALMKNHLTDDDLRRYHIVDGYQGLDFGRSSYYVKDGIIDADNVIDVIVTYKIKVPVPIKIIDEIPMVQRVTVRAWTGK